MKNRKYSETSTFCIKISVHHKVNNEKYKNPAVLNKERQCLLINVTVCKTADGEHRDCLSD